jgi:hypothetical protein
MDLHDSNLSTVATGVFVEAIRRGSFASMKSLNPGTRVLSASSLPSFSLLVAMKMNGPVISPLLGSAALVSRGYCTRMWHPTEPRALTALWWDISEDTTRGR